MLRSRRKKKETFFQLIFLWNPLTGNPVILVPSPNVAEDHQTRNAEALTDQDAALLVPDRLAGKELVDNLLGLLHDEERKETLSANIKKLGISDAAQRIATEVIKIIRQ